LVVIGISLAAAVVAATLVTLITARPLRPPIVVISPTPSSAPSPAAPTPAPSASSSTQPNASLPGAERFAIVVEKGCSPPGPPPYVRREDRNELVATLGNGYLCALKGVVSPDGRRLAYWLYETGRSEIALYEGGSSRTLVRLGDELLFGGLVWSSDGTGLVFGATKGGGQGTPSDYSALRTFDLATGSVKELARVTARYLTPVAWDRARRVVAAAGVDARGGSGEYLIITEDRAIATSAMPADVVLMSASPDAAFMTALSRKDFTILYWPLTSFAERKELRAPPGSGAGVAAWRPGGRELAVVVSGAGVQALELWSLDGVRRKLADVPGQSGGLIFRPDGSVVFVGGGRAVEVATGRAVDLVLAQYERVAASLFVAP
jgi:hypothetical protein